MVEWYTANFHSTVISRKHLDSRQNSEGRQAWGTLLEKSSFRHSAMHIQFHTKLGSTITPEYDELYRKSRHSRHYSRLFSTQYVLRQYSNTLIKAVEPLILEEPSTRCKHCINQIHQFLHCISRAIGQEESVTDAQKSSTFDVIIKQLMPCVLDDSGGQGLVQHLPVCKDSSYRRGVKFREDVIKRTVRGLLGLELMTSEGSFFLKTARRGCRLSWSRHMGVLIRQAIRIHHNTSALTRRG